MPAPLRADPADHETRIRLHALRVARLTKPCACGSKPRLKRRKGRRTPFIGRDCPRCATARTLRWRVRRRETYLASRRATYRRWKVKTILAEEQRRRAAGGEG